MKEFEFLKDIKKLKDPKFQVNDINFNITKLATMSGHEMFEDIRFALGQSADSIDAGAGEDQMAAMFFKSIMILPPNVIKGFRERIFEHIEFSRANETQEGWMKLSGLEDMAFENLEPIHVYEVFGRGLIVNFSGSFDAILSRFPGAQGLITLLKQ